MIFYLFINSQKWKNQNKQQLTRTTMQTQASFPCSLITQKIVSLLFTILLLFEQPSTAKKHHSPCPPSSCGQIRNITYPFRLKGDPSHCGNKRYELECDSNNATVLTLFSGNYHVHHIDYKNYSIKLSDAGLSDNANCSFIPRNFLYDSSFKFAVGPDDFGSQPFTLNNFDPDTVDTFDPSRVAYFNCTDAVTDDAAYVKVDITASRCSTLGLGHVYVMVGASYSVTEIKVGCSLMVATLTDKVPAEIGEGNNNVSYEEIRKVVGEGFSVSWLPAVCEEKCGKKTNCKVVNVSTGEVQCDRRYCHYAYHTTDKCGIAEQAIGYARGLGSRITFSTRNLGNPVGLEYFDGGIFIGRNIIPVILVTRYVLGVAVLLSVLIYIWRRRHWSIYGNIEHFLLDSNLNPIRYEYKEIKKMSGGFKVKLGKGGFGAVYKGKLRSGPDVAIKILNESNANGQDFINEVATIGRIHHVNVVRLVGYCVEKKKRALVYEFMPNGSLDKYIFAKEGTLPLSYEKMYEISLGVARGIAYLHQGCDMQILHFDIKPHNILLDDNFVPKVSDFGLAKLYPVDDSTVTLTAARGTLGYMAPELFYKNIGGVSYKADVYSFGMLLMEMASRRKNSNPNADESSQIYFPFWIHDQLYEEREIEIEDASEEEKSLVKKMFLVALWCIQLKPSDRPSMNKVVEMLEGDNDGSLALPPKPSFYSHEASRYVKEVNSNQASSMDSSGTSYLGETTTDYSMEDDD
nr:rust resistance kinase Lr10 isoform X2 [Arachis hypogaea]